MSYNKHIFFCTNMRENGKKSCNQKNSQEMRDYAKKRIKDLGLDGEGKVRMNSAGCLGKCAQGPVLVVYPDATWYQWSEKNDIDEIISSHIINNEPVQRLII